MKSFPLPAFQDKNLWVLHDGQEALVGPGDAQPVLACLQGEGLQLDTILVTPRTAEPDNLKLINELHRREESRERNLPASPRAIGQARETSTHSCARAFRP